MRRRNDEAAGRSRQNGDGMKIHGVYVLSRRSIARMLAAITAALMMLCGAATAQAEATVRRIHDVAGALLSLDRQMVGRLARTVIPDFMYLEYKSLYLELRPSGAAWRSRGTRDPTEAAVAQATAQGRRYATRKTLTIAQAAAITGLGRSTIKRLDKDPGNTNYPGRNATAKILAAWAQLRREGKIAVRAVRAANRPALGHIRS